MDRAQRVKKAREIVYTCVQNLAEKGELQQAVLQRTIIAQLVAQPRIGWWVQSRQIELHQLERWVLQAALFYEQGAGNDKAGR